MNTITLLIVYFSVMNIIAFATMGIDKWKAKRRAWRIPEATLFILAAIGGSIGSILGMYSFHHKTKHPSFVIGMPAILILQLAILTVLILSPIQFTFM